MIEYYKRTLSEKLIPEGYRDPYNIFNDANYEREILLKSPYKQSDEDVFQVLAVNDGNFVGTEIHFPIELNLDGTKYLTVSGHGLSVQKECRGSGVGSKLTDVRLDYSPSHSLILGAASQMHLSILRKFNAAIFEMPRFIYLRNSFSVLESKVGLAISVIATPIVNWALKGYFYKINKDVKKLNVNFQVEELKEVTDEVIDVIACDSHRFSEVHNKTWFEWILKNSLVKGENPCKRLYIVKKTNRVVAFFMTESRFYKEASHRGFKNINLGSIIEWGSIDQTIISDFEVCTIALASFEKNVDAIEVCCVNNKMKEYFSRRNLKQVGTGNVCLRFRDDSPLAAIDGIKNIKNWRLRPAMGDHSLS